MMPQGIPTYVFSARCASEGRSSIGRSRAPRSHSAVSTAHSIAAEDESPAPTGTSEVSDKFGGRNVVSRVAQRPDDAGDVAGPSTDTPGHQVLGRDRDRFRRGRATYGPVRVAGDDLGRHDRRLGQRERQHEAVVVVGVLADQVDTAGRAPRATRAGPVRHRRGVSGHADRTPTRRERCRPDPAWPEPNRVRSVRAPRMRRVRPDRRRGEARPRPGWVGR